MEHRLSATELARSVGDVLARIRYRGDSFLIERNGEPIARITPLDRQSPASVREAVAVWRDAGEPEPEFAEDLARIGESDRPPENPWEP